VIINRNIDVSHSHVLERNDGILVSNLFAGRNMYLYPSDKRKILYNKKNKTQNIEIAE